MTAMDRGMADHVRINLKGQAGLLPGPLHYPIEAVRTPAVRRRESVRLAVLLARDCIVAALKSIALTLFGSPLRMKVPRACADHTMSAPLTTDRIYSSARP